MLAGNPVVSNAKHYRKSMIASIKTLSYLDDRPVFELERICAEAWAEGGLEAEREARRKVRGQQRERSRSEAKRRQSSVSYSQSVTVTATHALSYTEEARWSDVSSVGWQLAGHRPVLVTVAPWQLPGTR